MNNHAQPDLPVARFVPDPELVARAHNLMLESEDHGHRYLRQRWEEAFAATRVALDVFREVVPSEAFQLDEENRADAERALDALTIAYAALDRMSEGILGWPMIGVLRGSVTTGEEFEHITEP